MPSAEELELESVLEVSQIKLLRNFSSIARGLARHEARLSEQQAALELAQLKWADTFAQFETRLANEHECLMRIVRENEAKAEAREQSASREHQALVDMEAKIFAFKESLAASQLEFDQKNYQQAQENMEILSRVEALKEEQTRLSSDLAAKEDKSAILELVAEQERISAKQHSLENEVHLNAHKVENLEILAERTEKEKPKKEVEFMREIEEKVLAEVQGLLGRPDKLAAEKQSERSSPSSIPSSSPSSTPLASSFRTIVPPSAPSVTSVLASAVQSSAGSPSASQHAEVDSVQQVFRVNIEKSLARNESKINDLEAAWREMEEHLRTLGKTGTARAFERESSANVFDRLNELKPELIKLWAKMDTLEDRIAFNERRLEEKTKALGELTAQMKDNSREKTEERLKALQNELYGGLKEVRAKLEGKVKQADYEKQHAALGERLKEAEALLALKSDKLEVKKALLFLESKIKEIILVISEDEEQEKDALLTKKQVKCMSCDKELDKLSGLISSPKGNWDAFPLKDHPPELLGKFGISNFGALARKIRKIENNELPILHKPTKTPPANEVGGFR